ncbi:MAG: Glu-specific endopeptidase [Gammaproteobacteria bacterium]|nr:Glu-specific endopeptidase [Gammaproteobacteria bacterium]
MRILLLMMALSASLPALADEGMWTFDNFPASAIEKTYGTTVTPEWLDHVRLATIRLTNCTASFISPEGLMLTNHHCVESCLAELSSKDNSLLDRGYSAAKRTDERRCSTQLADVLVGMENVTATVAKSLGGLGDKAANDARKKVLTQLEQTCEQASTKARSGRLKCQAVTLYQGGQYFIYKYKRYDDVRLVFAPEADIAAFGGDPDNFQFPRWSLDFSILRAYEHGKPAKTPNHLQINFAGPQANELVFVSGHPGSTQRLETRAQLEFERDESLPSSLLRAAELRGRYIQFGRTAPANEGLVEAPLNSLENGLKVRRKLLDALHDDALMARKSQEEKALRASAGISGADPWGQIEAATSRARALYLPHTFIEGAAGFNSILFRYARLLVRGADERTKPNTERLREYTDAALPRIEQQLYARVPIYAEVELLTMSFSLQRMREWLGPDHPVVRRLLAKDSPDTLATRLVAETKLDDAATRKQLWEGGKSAVDASRDPMIELARSLDAESRTIRKQYEDEVEAPITAASERIAAERFKAYGTQVYPDATFTLRLNAGTVQGWVENGSAVGPFTYLDRAFERATGASPFKIPDSWMAVKSQLDMRTPFCISTSSDIVGGNSGSPLVDAQGRIVGLMFDGNIHSISGAYRFDAGKNRAVALHPAIIREALEKVYGAKSLLAEMTEP